MALFPLRKPPPSSPRIGRKPPNLIFGGVGTRWLETLRRGASRRRRRRRRWRRRRWWNISQEMSGPEVLLRHWGRSELVLRNHLQLSIVRPKMGGRRYRRRRRRGNRGQADKIVPTDNRPTGGHCGRHTGQESTVEPTAGSGHSALFGHGLLSTLRINCALSQAVSQAV